MATLDDRLLGEKLENYCSSSEDEGDRDDTEQRQAAGRAPRFIPASDLPKTSPTKSGPTSNTGPKGVIRDWQRYKQLEAEARTGHSQERRDLAKHLSKTCKSHLGDDATSSTLTDSQLDRELDQVDQQIMEEFIRKRMEELTVAGKAQARFGSVIDIDSQDDFLLAIDCTPTEAGSDRAMTNSCRTVIVLLYEERARGCASMTKALSTLAEEYADVKFCRVRASLAGLSIQFRFEALPTLQVYRQGQLVGNFIRLLDEFGDEVFVSDVESFLVDHGMLPDRTVSLQKPSFSKGPIDDSSDELD